MRHGHFMGYGYNGAVILVLILVGAVILFYLILRDYFQRKSYNENTRIVEILKQRYVMNEINVDEYMERKALIEDENSSDPALLILKERYAMDEIDSEEFVKRREGLLSKNVKSAEELLKERYAKGEITTEQFNEIKKHIS